MEGLEQESFFKSLWPAQVSPQKSSSICHLYRWPPSCPVRKERLDSASIGELLDVELPLKITALAEEPAQQAAKVGSHGRQGLESRSNSTLGYTGEKRVSIGQRNAQVTYTQNRHVHANIHSSIPNEPNRVSAVCAFL